MNIKRVKYTHNSEKNTIWMDVYQIAKIYDTSAKKISSSIHGIFANNELEAGECTAQYPALKKIIKSVKNISILSKKYTDENPIFYNHEVVLLIGYELDPAKAEAFEEFLEKEFGIKDRTDETDKIISSFSFEGKDIDCIQDVDGDTVSINTNIFTSEE